MPQLGPLEIAVVLLIALLVFGPNRLPELAKQAGAALKELRKIQTNIKQDLSQMMSDETDVSDSAAPPPSLPPLAEGTAGTEVADVTEATESPVPPTPPPLPPPPPEAD